MNNLFETRLLYKNSVKVGVSLKLTLHEAIILKNIMGSVAGSSHETARKHTDAIDSKLSSVGFEEYIDEEDIYHYGTNDNILNSTLEFNNNSLQVIERNVQEFLNPLSTPNNNIEEEEMPF